MHLENQQILNVLFRRETFATNFKYQKLLVRRKYTNQAISLHQDETFFNLLSKCDQNERTPPLYHSFFLFLSILTRFVFF